MPNAPRLKIGLSACFQHADPTRPLFTNKTLQYVEQSIAHWLMSAGAMVVMVPCPTGETARGDVTLQHYAEWLDGVVMHGGADVWPGNYGEEPLREEWIGDRVRCTANDAAPLIVFNPLAWQLLFAAPVLAAVAAKDLAYYDVGAKAWVVEPTDYVVLVGPSSRAADLRGVPFRITD